MSCYRPLKAFQGYPGGPLSFGEVGTRPGARFLKVPCGKCVGCKLDYAHRWAVRCVHESQMHSDNCMVTLTYDDGHLPTDWSLDHKHFQDFMKRLRERIAPQRIRNFMCGEYGEANGRPHYHACLFGYDPSDRVFYRTSGAGSRIFSSDFLETVWQNGAVYVGNVTYESASYVARYLLKGGKDRSFANVHDGEVFRRVPEYCKMSNRPGIGLSWFVKYMCDVYPRDGVVIRGRPQAVPRYYDKLLERLSPLYLAELKAARRERADLKYERLSEGDRYGDVERLAVHEAVKLASIQSLKRS